MHVHTATIGRFFPSSKTCSYCGYVLKELRLTVREWECPSCHAKLDRDVNAAGNILAEGIKSAQSLLQSNSGASSSAEGEYYYNSKKKGELDFVVEQAGRVLPIEVKSGKDYEKHSALDNVMSVAEYGIEEACVFTSDNVKVNGKLTYLPIYMSMFLQDDPIDFIDTSVDKFKL